MNTIGDFEFGDLCQIAKLKSCGFTVISMFTAGG